MPEITRSPSNVRSLDDGLPRTRSGLVFRHAPHTERIDPRGGHRAPPQWVREFSAQPRAQSLPTRFSAVLSGGTVSFEIPQRRLGSLRVADGNLIVHALTTPIRRGIRSSDSTIHDGGTKISFSTFSPNASRSASPDLKVKVEVVDGKVVECTVTDKSSRDTTIAAHFDARPRLTTAQVVSQRGTAPAPAGWSNLPLELKTQVLEEAAIPGHTPRVATNRLMQLRLVDRTSNDVAQHIFTSNQHPSVSMDYVERSLRYLIENHSEQELSRKVDQLFAGQQHLRMNLGDIHDPAKRQIVLDALSQCSGLVSLDLSMRNSPQSATETSNLLNTIQARNPGLENVSLSLVNMGLGPDDMTTISRIPGVRTLDVSYNRVGDLGVQRLCSIPGLTVLNIAACRLMGDRLTSQSATALAAHARLASLNMSHNEMRNGTLAPFATNATITDLNVSCNILGLADATALASMPGLTLLNAEDNRFLHGGAAAFANNRTITHLNLRLNRLGDQGVQALAPNGTLIWLDLGNNSVRQPGVGLVDVTDVGATALANNQSIRTLILDRNMVGDGGAIALSRNTVLRDVDLSSTVVGDVGALAFQHSATFEKVSLSSNNLIHRPTRQTLTAANPNTNYVF